MKKSILLLFSLIFSSLLSAQSISLQVGESALPNLFYCLFEDTKPKSIMPVATFTYQYPIGKRLEIVTGLQVVNLNSINSLGVGDCIGPCPVEYIYKINQVFTEIPLGFNIRFFSSPSKKWNFLLQPSVFTSFFGFSTGQIEYKDGTSQIDVYPYRHIGFYSLLFGGQLAEETRFHFAPKFYACAKIWARSQYMLSSFYGGRDNNGLGGGLQIGIGYKWK